MKKTILWLTAALLAALCLAFVACEDTPAETTPAETTPATDVSTDAPTDVSTEEPTVAPTDVPTDAPTDSPTDAPVDQPTEEPTEPPTEDPNAPIYMMDAEYIAQKANKPDDPFTAWHIAFAATVTEDDRTYTRIAACGDDPYIALIPLGSDMYLTDYLVISYRNNSRFPGEFYLGSGGGWTGSGDNFNANWKTDNEWDLMIVDLTTCGVTSIVDNIITYTRIDIFRGETTEDEWFDIEFVAFFETPEQAVAYYEARHGKLTNGYNDNSVVTPLPEIPEEETNESENPEEGTTEPEQPKEDPDTPSDEPAVLIDFDLSQLSGNRYESSNAALGNSHTGPVFNIVDGYVYLGNIDLSKYSKCEITYSTTNDKAAFDQNGPHIIGLKSEQSSYGFDTNHNDSGDLAHTEMVFSEIGYSDLRVAVIDLTDVQYNGAVYVSGHNVWLHSIFITGIKLIP